MGEEKNDPEAGPPLFIEEDGQLRLVEKSAEQAAIEAGPDAPPAPGERAATRQQARDRPADREPA
jgi:hypothetical protein